MFFRFLCASIIVISLSACTTTNFNQQYQNSKWETILLSPIAGDKHHYVENAFIHEFATNSTITFVEPSVVKQTAIKLGLLEELESSPVTALKELSAHFKAQGFITGNIKTGKEQYLDSTTNYTELTLRLYSAADGKIVASSVENSSSVLFGHISQLKNVTEEVFEDFEDFFYELNSSFSI